ncbi:MAG: hypothetical protein EP318_04550 [Rhodobacteraceae bacterium]|nr:MAG: hypothetical protein EP318_04550 [Paracoccaceae bacterium]
MGAFVIAVSGTSGSGKSTLLSQLAERIERTTRMHFDDYIVLGSDPGDIQNWLDAGADPDAIETPAMVDHLKALRQGGALALRGAAQEGPADFVLLEEPFGSARAAIAPHVDLSVHIDLPPDIALARRSLRTITSLPDNPPHARQAAALSDLELQFVAYLGAGRAAYAAAETAARAAADLTLDGLEPVDILVDRVRAVLIARGALEKDTVS